ncbi:hypothetical protein [Planococcus sp. ISL-109]|uniref:hypothetical protein n=1 Tax=Planococcus sp. ISL-109 TaxID=2819166 RepID=UPI002034AD35|nr:hypothetical protein [Planococcus sp. ISL-109]
MTNSYTLQSTKTETKREASVQNVMYLYGVLLFSGLLLSIFTHGIEDISGFMSFVLITGMLYFLMVNFYFKGDTWRSRVYIAMSLVALTSLCMVFYLA